MLPGGAFSPLFSAALIQQLPALQQLQQLACFQQNSQSTVAAQFAGTPLRKARVGGSSVKTAKVWKYFDQLPVEEQAAECQLCRKKIKATNSSTTGMIRHLRSCHVAEYQLLQQARATGPPLPSATKFADEQTRLPQQKSPSSLSSASDTTASTTASPPFASGAQLQQTSPSPPEHEKASTTPLSSVASVYSKPSSASCIEQQQPPPPPPPPPPANDALLVNSQLSVVKLHTQLAIMMIVDGLPSSVVDRPGFRGLLRLLLPMHTLPTSDKFEAEILPATMAHLRHELAQQFVLNNPLVTPLVTPLATSVAAPSLLHSACSSPLDMSLREPKACCSSASPIDDDHHQQQQQQQPIRVEDDSDSASSADATEQPVTTAARTSTSSSSSSSSASSTSSSSSSSAAALLQMHADPSVLGALQHCRALAHLFYAVQLPGARSPHRPSDPHAAPNVKQDVAFVGANWEQINAWLKEHADCSVGAISPQEGALLSALAAQLQTA